MKATTIAGVIAGEASYKGTDAQTFSDMVSIASVMHNRALATGQTIDSVVMDRDAFNAYGNSLPPGVGQKQVDMAEQAHSWVQKNGPVTGATYYSTPDKFNNLPPGLRQTDQTIGHVFAVDPQDRPINVQGVTRTLTQDAQGLIGQAVQRTIGTVKAATQQVATKLGLTGNEDPGLTFDGSALKAPGKGRNQMPRSETLDAIGDAVRSVVPGGTVGIWSGAEPPGAKPVGAKHRHPSGLAADVDIFDKDMKRVTSKVDMQDIAMNFAAANPTTASIGYDPAKPGDYMGLGRMHMDIARDPAVWGDNKPGRAPYDQGFTDNIGFARQMGLTGDGSWRSVAGRVAPTPTQRPTAFAGLEKNAFDNPKSVTNYSKVAEDRATRHKQTAPMQGPPLSAFKQDRAVSQVPSSERFGTKPQQGPPMSAFKQDRPTSPVAVKADRVAPQQPSAERFGTTPSSGLLGMPSPGRMIDAPKVGEVMTPGLTKAVEQAKVGNVPTVSQNAFAGVSAPTPAQAKAALNKPVQGPPMSAMTPAASVAEQVGQQLAGQPAAPITKTTVVPDRPVATVAKPAKVSAPKQVVAPAPVAKALVSGAVASLPGAQIGSSSLLGGLSAAAKSVFGSAPTPSKYSVGSGLGAMSGLSGSSPAGATAYSRSTPGYSKTSLGTGWLSKTNQYGVTSYDYTGPVGSISESIQSGGGLFGGLFGGSTKSTSSSSGKSSSSKSSSSKSSSSKSSSSGGNKSNSRSDSAGY